MNDQTATVLTRPLGQTRKASLPEGHRFRNWLPLLTLLALAGDAVAVGLGLYEAYVVRFNYQFPSPPVGGVSPSLSTYREFFLLGDGLLLSTFAYLGFYRRENYLRFAKTFQIIVKGVFFWLFLFLAFSTVLKFDPPISRLFALFSFFFCTITLLAWRRILFQVVRSSFWRYALKQQLLIVGASPEVQRIVTSIQQDPWGPFALADCFLSLPVDNGLAALQNRLAKGDIDVVLLGNADLPQFLITGIANACEQSYVQFKNIPSNFQVLLSGLAMETFYGVPVLGVTSLPLDYLFNRLVKRLVDLAGAVVGLVGSAPMVLLFAGLVRRESPGPVFYSQMRVGRNGKLFRIYKMRTMTVDADRDPPPDSPVTETTEATLRIGTPGKDPRLLRIGSVMRRWNIDEIPQFWNVLRGDMSLVGPRPERPEHMAKIVENVRHYNARHAAKPGMTGWAQVNGFRGPTDLNERVRCDLFYLENWSLLLDLQIMLQTLVTMDHSFE